MSKAFLILFLFLFSINCFSQGENNNWYFGNYAGITFNGGAPAALVPSSIYQWEGCASVSNRNGLLLFYTDGVKVWNRNHQQMMNGFGLLGGNSSTNSATIAPIPGNPEGYYIFTCPEFGNAGYFSYSIVDMTLDNGLGAVALKNQPLHANSSEKCVIIKKDECSYWVVGHDTMSTFYSYLVDSAGFHPPVLSTSTINLPFTVGAMKSSPQGDKIAAAIWEAGTDTFAVYSFNTTTGDVGNEMKFSLTGGILTTYGLEFSPGGEKLYVNSWSSNTFVYQYDLSAFNYTAIQSSRTLVNSGGINFGDSQLGPDNKIYISAHQGSYLAVINYPDSNTAACGFADSAVALSPGVSGIGLPKKVPVLGCNNQNISVNFTVDMTDPCPSECVVFTNLSTGATAFQWLFPGAIPASSTDTNPQNICYPFPGDYDVTLIASNGNVYDTVVNTSFIHVPAVAQPVYFEMNDTLICTSLNAVSFQWFENGVPIPGAADYYYVAAHDGLYSVQVTDTNGCTSLSQVLDIDVSVETGVEPDDVIEYHQGIFSIRTGSNSTLIVSVFDATGRLIHREQSMNDSGNMIFHLALTPSVYLFTVEYSGKYFSRKLRIEQ